MIRITICNHKGGTGKTTTSIQLAAALGHSGMRTLVIDLDPQGFLSRTLGLSVAREADTSLVLFEEDVLWHRISPCPTGGFDVLPASPNLTRFQRKLTKPTDVLWVREALENGASYDAVIFDTAAAITVYSLNALVASGHALIPVTPEYQPIVGAEQTLQTIQMVQKRLNPDLKDPRFLFTQVDARKRSHRSFRGYLRKKYGPLVLDTIVRTSTSLSAKYEGGGTVFDHAPHSRGARDYANAADEILEYVRGHPSMAAAPARSPRKRHFHHSSVG